MTTALILLGLTGCWKTVDDADFSLVPFSNDYASVPGLVETIETNLACPTGGTSNFYIVYPEDAPGPLPVVVVFHSSAFDYVLDPQSDNALAGTHFQGTGEDGVTRMDQQWGVQKVWETFGMHPQVDPAEMNLGTLPAVLLNQGVAAIYPANCWGDLWHNEAGLYPNDLATEYVDRNGGAFAWWSVRWLFDPGFAESQGISTGAALDPEQLYMIGLGDGARAATEILLRDDAPDVKGILLDSPIDNLQDWADELPGVEEGLERIYFDPSSEGDQDYNLWSLKRQINRGEVDDLRIAVVHSSADPQVPAGNINGLLTALEEHPDNCVADTNAQAHVFTNSSVQFADEMLDFVFNGERRGCDGEGGGDDTGDTGDTGG